VPRRPALGRAIVRLIFFRIFFDDLIEHLHGFGALIGHHKTGGEFFPARWRRPVAIRVRADRANGSFICCDDAK